MASRTVLETLEAAEYHITENEWHGESGNCYSGWALNRKGCMTWQALFQDHGTAKAVCDAMNNPPALLEALKNLVDLAKNQVADAEDWHDYQHAIAAIAKAEAQHA